MFGATKQLNNKLEVLTWKIEELEKQLKQLMLLVDINKTNQENRLDYLETNLSATLATFSELMKKTEPVKKSKAKVKAKKAVKKAKKVRTSIYDL